jgi:hypothetical protein
MRAQERTQKEESKLNQYLQIVYEQQKITQYFKQEKLNYTLYKMNLNVNRTIRNCNKICAFRKEDPFIRSSGKKVPEQFQDNFVPSGRSYPLGSQCIF